MEEDAGSLPELIAEVIDRHGYTSLAEMSRHTKIPYQTLWAWQRGTRSRIRPPAPAALDAFARDFGVPRAVVYRAAGRAFPDPANLAPEMIEFVAIMEGIPPGERREALTFMHLYRMLREDERQMVTRVMRALADHR